MCACARLTLLSLPSCACGLFFLQCCIPGGGGGCGAYANAPTQSIIGNGNQAFAVTKILREHLSNPREYDASPNDEDNTMILPTACAFDRMRNAARAAGVSLQINSGQRRNKHTNKETTKQSIWEEGAFAMDADVETPCVWGCIADVFPVFFSMSLLLCASS